VLSSAAQTKGKMDASTTPSIFYVGLIVETTSTTGSALENNTGEVIDFKRRPTLKYLLSQGTDHSALQRRNADEINYPSGAEQSFVFKTRQQAHSPAMSLLSQRRRQAIRKVRWGGYFGSIP